MKIYDYKMNVVKKMKSPLKKEGFINCVTYDESNKLYVCTATDGYIHFFQKSKIKIDFLKSVEAPCIQTGIWYMDRQKLWLTGGKDNKLRHWNIPLGIKDGDLMQTIDIHKDEITCCVEVLKPFCVATCSLDRTIVLFDIVNREHLRTIDDHHEKGIKHLRYSIHCGAQLISMGSEIYANVWSPESLISEIHTGKLKGHKKGIVDG